MNETLATAIKIGATVLFAIFVISVTWMFVSPTSDTAKSGVSELNTLNAEFKDQKFSIYENTELSGSQVVNAIKRFQKDGEANTVGIRVKTGRGSDNWYYNTVSSNGDSITPATKPSNISNPNSTEYINPAGMFKANILRDSNQVVRGIEFIQK